MKLRTDDEIRARARCQVSDLFDVGSNNEPALVEVISKYLRVFVVPTFNTELVDGKKELDDQPCVGCGKPLLGLTAFIHGGGFTWGLAHGEGHCQACYWPARAHHFVKSEEGGELLRLHNMVLQYHHEAVNLPRWRERFGGE